MTELTVPKMDFSSLAELPKLYREAQTTANRNALLSQLSPNPDAANVNSLALQLAQAGDLAGANAMATLGKNLAADQTDFIKNYQFAVKNGLQPPLPFPRRK